VSVNNSIGISAALILPTALSAGAVMAMDDNARVAPGFHSRDYYESTVVQQRSGLDVRRTGVTFDIRPPGCSPVGGAYFSCPSMMLERRAGQYEQIEIR
jgi:hypothetical protein